MLSYRFWREFAEIPNVWAIKIAPFNRYQTIDVVRAVVEAGRDDIALYTGNDDNIVADLLTPFPVHVGGTTVVRWIDGGLLGQWAVWTRARGRDARRDQGRARVTGEFEPTLLSHGAALTDANAAVFDAAHGFAGCIPGIHEVLRRQGLLDGIWCLDPRRNVVAGAGGRDHARRAELSGGDGFPSAVILSEAKNRFRAKAVETTSPRERSSARGVYPDGATATVAARIRMTKFKKTWPSKSARPAARTSVATRPRP